jgi:ATP-binding cassette, subfamily C, bacterial
MTRTSPQTEARSDLLRWTLRRSGAGILYAAFVGVFINALHLVVPLYMLQIYDRVVSSRSLDTLTMLTILAVSCLVFLAVLDFIRARVFIIVGEQMVRRLNGTVLEAAVNESLQNQSARSANAVRDLQELRQFVTGGPITLPFDALFTPLFLVVLFLLHPSYGVVAIAAIVVLACLGVAMEYVARRPAALANEAAVRSHAEIGSAIRHAEVIEALGMLPAVIRRWRHGQNRALMLVGVGNSGARAITAISRSIRMGLQIAMLATGAILVIDHEVSPGTMVCATIIMGRLLHPLEQMIEGWRSWSNATSALTRIRDLLSKHESARGSTPYTAEEGRLLVDRVSFVPPGSDRPVLRGVTFALEPGEVLGVIGPSGAGKSTLARLLVGVWRPTTGGIFLDGHNVYAWERESFGKQIGYLPQNPALLDGTVRDNIARFDEADVTDVIVAAKRADVHEMIGRLPLGYETHLGEAGFTISGGQRQRLALARALFGTPRLVVLDEPNANLDGAGEQALMQTIREAKKAGITVIIVAHRMSVMTVADKLLVLRDGTVEQFGPRQDVMKALTTQGAPGRSNDPKIARLPVQRTVRS